MATPRLRSHFKDLVGYVSYYCATDDSFLDDQVPVTSYILRVTRHRSLLYTGYFFILCIMCIHSSAIRADGTRQVYNSSSTGVSRNDTDTAPKLARSTAAAALSTRTILREDSGQRVLLLAAESCNTPSHSLGSARGAAAVRAHSTAEIAAINWNFIFQVIFLSARNTRDGAATERCKGRGGGIGGGQMPSFGQPRT